MEIYTSDIIVSLARAQSWWILRGIRLGEQAQVLVHRQREMLPWQSKEVCQSCTFSFLFQVDYLVQVVQLCREELPVLLHVVSGAGVGPLTCMLGSRAGQWFYFFNWGLVLFICLVGYFSLLERTVPSIAFLFPSYCGGHASREWFLVFLFLFHCHYRRTAIWGNVLRKSFISQKLQSWFFF